MVKELLQKLKEKGISQTDIYRATGIPQSSISRYISGRYRPNHKELAKLVLFAESKQVRMPLAKFKEHILHSLM